MRISKRVFRNVRFILTEIKNNNKNNNPTKDKQRGAKMDKDEKFYFRKHKEEGSKRWTIPMDTTEHLDNLVKVTEELLEELRAIRKQRIASYLRILHARNAVQDANYSTKLLANGNDATAHSSYKGAV